MHCAIYKGPKKTDHYLYVEKEDHFERVPEALRTLLGPLQLVMTLTLSAERPLAQTDVIQVMAALVEQGYFLQMPPPVVEPRLDS